MKLLKKFIPSFFFFTLPRRWGGTKGEVADFTHQAGKSGAGFTLMEMLVVLGIFVAIAAFGLFMSMDVYRGNNLHAEKNMVISILQKARTGAMNNINEEPHGVRFETGKYILFQGADWGSAVNKQEIQSSTKVSITNPAPPFNIIFSQLSAATASTTFKLTDGAKEFTMQINSEGGITWY